MVEKKNQHYVPQSYLRPWANERDKIVSFIPKNNVEYSNVPIGNVASSDYFYSKQTDLEDVIEVIEYKQERVLKKIRNSYSEYPILSGAEDRYFRSFILFQRYRTNAVRQDVSKTGEILAEEVAEKTDVEVDEIRNWTNEFQRLMKRMMLHSLLNPGLISNLEALVLIDTTGKNFITSEVPILFDNPAGSTLVAGVANAGLQIFCPVSPTHCVLFIDPDCYAVSKNTSRPIPIKNQNVINDINSFHARHNPQKIFYQETGRESELNHYLEGTDDQRGLETSVEELNDKQKVMLSLNQRSPRPSPDIPFISTIRHPQNKESRFGDLSSKVTNRCRERVNAVVDSHENDINEALIDTIAQITKKDPSKDSPASWEAP